MNSIGQPGRPIKAGRPPGDGPDQATAATVATPGSAGPACHDGPVPLADVLAVVFRRLLRRMPARRRRELLARPDLRDLLGYRPFAGDGAEERGRP
jgi:hypothetical protein